MKNGQSLRLDEERAAIYEWFQEGIKAACQQNTDDWARSYVLPLPPGGPQTQPEFVDEADKRFELGVDLLRERREWMLKKIEECHADR